MELPGTAQAYTVPSKPPLAADPASNQVLAFNAQREVLLVVDPESGARGPGAASKAAGRPIDRPASRPDARLAGGSPLHRPLLNRARRLDLAGGATPYACSLDPPAAEDKLRAGGGSAQAAGHFDNNRLFYGRSQVNLVDAFALCGCAVLFREGAASLALVHPAGAGWAVTKIGLPEPLELARVEPLFPRKFLLAGKGGAALW